MRILISPFSPFPPVNPFGAGRLDLSSVASVKSVVKKDRNFFCCRPVHYNLPPRFEADAPCAKLPAD